MAIRGQPAPRDMKKPTPISLGKDGFKVRWPHDVMFDDDRSRKPLGLGATTRAGTIGARDAAWWHFEDCDRYGQDTTPFVVLGQ